MAALAPVPALRIDGAVRALLRPIPSPVCGQHWSKIVTPHGSLNS